MKPLVLLFLAISITLTTESLKFTSENQFSRAFLSTLDTFKDDFITRVKEQYEKLDEKNKIVKFIKKNKFLGNSLKKEQIIGEEIFDIKDDKEYDRFFFKILSGLNIKIDFNGKEYLKEAWETLIFISSNSILKEESINYLMIFQKKENSSIKIVYVFLKDIIGTRDKINLNGVLCNKELKNFLKGFKFIYHPGSLIVKEQNNLLIDYLNLNVYKLLNDVFRSPEDFSFPDFK